MANNGGGNNSGSTKPSPSPSTSPSPSSSPTPTCNSCTVGRLTRIWSEHSNGGYQEIADALINEIERQCPGINVQVRPDQLLEKSQEPLFLVSLEEKLHLVVLYIFI